MTVSALRLQTCRGLSEGVCGIGVHPEYGKYVLALYRIAKCEYDPLACMDELLCAILTIGYRYETGEDISLPVVDFCCRYGHLGFETAGVEKIYDDNTVKLYRENVLGKKALTVSELYDSFKPFEREFRNQQKRKLPPLLDELRRTTGQACVSWITPTARKWNGMESTARSFTTCFKSRDVTNNLNSRPATQKWSINQRMEPQNGSGLSTLLRVPLTSVSLKCLRTKNVVSASANAAASRSLPPICALSTALPLAELL